MSEDGLQRVTGMQKRCPVCGERLERAEYSFEDGAYDIISCRNSTEHYYQRKEIWSPYQDTDAHWE